MRLDFSVRNGKRYFPHDKAPEQKILYVLCTSQKKQEKGYASSCVTRMGLEPTTPAVGRRHSSQLNYQAQRTSSVKCTKLFLMNLPTTTVGRMISRFPNRNRAISTPRLNALLRVHLVPINVIISHGPQRRLILELASHLDAFSAYPFRT